MNHFLDVDFAGNQTHLTGSLIENKLWSVTEQIHATMWNQIAQITGNWFNVYKPLTTICAIVMSVEMINITNPRVLGH